MSTTAEREALLPCPFCGSDLVSASMGERGDGSPYPYIECESCGANTEPDVWNRRASQPYEPRAEPPDRNMEGAHEFVRAVVMNQPMWPNKWGQDVAAAAFFLTGGKRDRWIADLPSQQPVSQPPATDAKDATT